MGAWPPHGFAAGVVAVSALYLASMPALARAARPVTPREAGP
jgi:hypothetical protein